MDEKQIIRFCQKGRHEYCETLIVKYEKPLYRYCFHLCSNPQDAADLFQETWFKAISRLKSYDEAYSFKNWLFTIASNEFRDRYRKRARRNVLEKGFRNADTMRREMESAESADISADTLIEENESRLQLKQEVSSLKWQFKSVVVLHYYEERSVRDISEVLKIPEGTVKSRLAKARKILKERMGHYYE